MPLDQSPSRQMILKQIGKKPARLSMGGTRIRPEKITRAVNFGDVNRMALLIAALLMSYRYLDMPPATRAPPWFSSLPTACAVG